MNENKLKILSAIDEYSLNTQRDIAAFTNISLGTVNKVISILTSENHLFNDGKKLILTKDGYSFLKKRQIKNAIILAAGFGSRMLPVTLSTPKPLVTVNGTVLIETVINGLIASGVDNIHIIVGYRKEQFTYLTNKYPNINFIINKEYIYKNNISSIYSAIDIFEQGNCCVCEADLLIKDPSVFHKYVDTSFYLAKYFAGKTGEWCVKLKNAYVSHIGVGGTNTHTLAGISYWTPEATGIIAKQIKTLYPEKSSNYLFWDNVVDMCLKDIKVKIDVITNEQIIEVDTILDLTALDRSYEKYLMMD